MVFYAYSKNSKDDTYWRYLITAPSMEIIDEWFRALQEKIGEENLIRISPEFYAHDKDKVDLGRSTWTANQVPQFMNKMTFTLLSDVDGRIYNTFNNGQVTDHISGKTFYIRSKSDPRVFWHERNGKVYASQSGRTRFRVTTNDKKYEGKVMIPSDSITISLPYNNNLSVAAERGGGVIIDSSSMNLTLGDLKKIFVQNYYENDPNRIIRDVDGGEEWELVV